MNKGLVVSVLLAALLVACSSKPLKDTPVAVEDKSPEMSQSTDATTADDSSATAGMSDSDMSVNPLTDPNNILSKRSVYFDYDSDEVKSEIRPLVEAHAKYLLAHPEAKVVLQGVQDKQIETVSYGEEKAGASCRDESCWKEDRRVDIVYQGE